MSCIAVHVRTCYLRLSCNVPAEAQQSVIVKTEDGVVVIVYEEPLLTVLSHKHSILHRLVYTTETHQIYVVGSQFVYVEVLLPLSVKLRLIAIARVQPHIQILQSRGVGAAVRIAGLESLIPVVIKTRNAARKQAVRIARVKLLPALHLRIVKAWNVAEAEHALCRFVVVEVILAHEYQRVFLILVIEHHYRKTVNTGTHVIFIAVVYGSLLSLCSARIFQRTVHTDLHVGKSVVPYTCHTCVVRARRLGIVSLQTPRPHWLRTLLERVLAVFHHSALAYHMAASSQLRAAVLQGV